MEQFLPMKLAIMEWKGLKMPKKKIVVIPSIVESCGKIAINAWKKSKVDNPSSRKAAIRANCLQCFGGSPKDVANCESKDCVFHQFRITG